MGLVGLGPEWGWRNTLPLADVQRHDFDSYVSLPSLKAHADLCQSAFYCVPVRETHLKVTLENEIKETYYRIKEILEQSRLEKARIAATSWTCRDLNHFQILCVLFSMLLLCWFHSLRTAFTWGWTMAT